MTTNRKLPYVIASVHGIQLAISAEYVRQIVTVPRWHVIPRLPHFARGVIDFRGAVIPLLDLRLRMDMQSSLAEVDEMVAMLHAREQDHVRWLAELEASIREVRPFTLARDPTKCAFGKWYHAYTTADIGFSAVMHQFDAPHRRIHNIADAALDLVANGHPDKAQALIDSTRSGDLSEVRRLFAEARDAFVQSHHELAVVLAHGSSVLSVTVDQVDSVEAIDEETTEDTRELLGSFRSDFVRTVFRRRNDKGLAYVLEPSQLLAGVPLAASA